MMNATCKDRALLCYRQMVPQNRAETGARSTSLQRVEPADYEPDFVWFALRSL